MADRTVMEVHSPAHRVLGSRRLSHSALRRFFTAMLLSKEIWIIYASAFLCGRASLGSGIYPFGLALFWTVIRSGRRTHAIGAFITIMLGMATVAPVHRLLATLVVLLACLFLDVGQVSERPRWQAPHLWRQGVVIAALHVGTRILFARLFEAPWENPLWVGMEASLVATTIIMWGPLAEIWGGEFRSRISRQGWVAIALFSVMLSLGLAGLQSGPLVPSELWNRLVTLAGAFIGGATTGAAVGTALAWIMGMNSVVPMGGMSIYALSGLLAGLFAARGKLWVGVGFLLGHFLLSIQTNSPTEIVYSLIHAVLALALLVLIPNGWLRSLERALPGSRARERFIQVREDKLREAVSERLAKMGGLLAEMGRTFAVAGGSQATQEAETDDVAVVVEKISQRLCRKCPGYRKCWEDHMYQSYKDVVEFLHTGQARGELREADMSLSLRQRCIKTSQLTQVAHGVLVEREERLRWQQRLEGQANVVPAQLQGVASLLEGLAEQVLVETGRSDELQVMLADALHEERVEASRVEVRPLGSEGRYEILVERFAPCDRIGIWREQVAKVVASTLSDEYTVWNETCDVDGKCSLRFAKLPPYHIQHSSVVFAKDRDGVSGDTFTTVDLIDGRVAIILSDGMGSGAHAALQSQTASQLLGTLLETGFDLRSAVRSVNSLLLMRSTEESFATLDAVVIDQFTGTAEFLKVGSAPSFIVRGSEVTVIRSNTLPVGIVNQVDARVQQRHLQPGDTIVLVTDGLLDSVSRSGDQEEWLARVLRREETQAPQQLLDSLLDRVSEVTGGVWQDDVTVAAIRYTRRPSTDQGTSIPEYRRLDGVGQ